MSSRLLCVAAEVRGVRTDVYKYGFWLPRDSTRYQGEQMPWAELLLVHAPDARAGCDDAGHRTEAGSTVGRARSERGGEGDGELGDGVSAGGEVRWSVDGVERAVAIEAERGSVGKRVQRVERAKAASTTVLARGAYADIIVRYAEHSSP